MPELMRAYDQVPVRVGGEDVFVYVNLRENAGLIPGRKYRVKLRMKIGKPSEEGHQIPRFWLLKAEAQEENQLDPRQFIAS